MSYSNIYVMGSPPGASSAVATSGPSQGVVLPGAVRGAGAATATRRTLPRPRSDIGTLSRRNTGPQCRVFTKTGKILIFCSLLINASSNWLG